MRSRVKEKGRESGIYGTWIEYVTLSKDYVQLFFGLKFLQNEMSNHRQMWDHFHMLDDSRS